MGMFAPVETFDIDQAGRVRSYQGADRRGARLSTWQVIGRDFFRELGWTVGAEAAERIARFRARGYLGDSFSTRVVTRAGARDLEISLRRGRDGGTVVQLQYARDSVSPARNVSVDPGGGRSSSPVSGASARLSGGGAAASSAGQPRTPNQ